MSTQIRLCEFIDIGMDSYSCSKCGITVSSPDGPPALACSSLDITEFLMVNNSENVCTESEIESRFNICTDCEFFQNNSCSQCGCRIVRNIEFQNKLFWKNESCPINKW